MKRKKTKTNRPKLPHITEEMKQWSAMLGQELSGWSHAKSRPMFGLLAFYRKAKIFAGLPVTRGINSPNSVIFKINPMPSDLLRRAIQDPRIDTDSALPGTRWYAFELNSADDLRDALWWLNQAYERAK
jgi:hypothetical protein